MTSEAWLYERLKTIALMAAIIEAGDRARSNVPHGDDRYDTPQEYAKEAALLFAAVDTLEAGLPEPSQ